MTISHVSEVIQGWLSWCPNTPTMRTVPVIHPMPQGSMFPIEPDGGAGGSGRINRGTLVATGSIRTLMNNKRLFWYSFLTGLVILFMFAAEFSLHVYSSYPHPEMPYPVWIALTFGIELIAIVCINFLLAGLIVSASPDISRRVETIGGFMVHMRSIALWSFILAVLGTAFFVILNQYFGNLTTALQLMISQFPFDFILEEPLRGPGPIGGGFHATNAATYTILATIINLGLFVVTLFVIPLLVLENKSLRGAVAESASLFKKTWREILACFLMFFTVFCVFSLISVIFQPVFNAVSLNGPFWNAFWYGGGWLAIGAIYILAWCILASIGSTAMGIATLNLYMYGKTGVLPGVTKGMER